MDQSIISTFNGKVRKPYTMLIFTSYTPVAVADGIIDLTMFNANRIAMMVRMTLMYRITPPFYQASVYRLLL